MKRFSKIAVFAVLLLLVAFVVMPMTAEAKGNGGCKSYCSHNCCHNYCNSYCNNDCCYPWWYYNTTCYAPVCEVPVYTCEPCYTYCQPSYCNSYCNKNYCKHDCYPSCGSKSMKSFQK